MIWITRMEPPSIVFTFKFKTSIPFKVYVYTKPSFFAQRGAHASRPVGTSKFESPGITNGFLIYCEKKAMSKCSFFINEITPAFLTLKPFLKDTVFQMNSKGIKIYSEDLDMELSEVKGLYEGSLYLIDSIERAITEKNI
jgi:hypothetical protein